MFLTEIVSVPCSIDFTEVSTTKRTKEKKRPFPYSLFVLGGLDKKKEKKKINNKSQLLLSLKDPSALNPAEFHQRG